MQEYFESKQQGVNAGSIRLLVSPSQVARNTFFYVQETGYLEVDTSYSVSLNKLDSFLLILVVDGTGKLIYENQEYLISKDDLAFLDCKKQHEYFTVGKEEWRFLYLYFNGKIAPDYYNLISKEQPPIFKIRNFKTMGSLFWQIIALHKKYNSNAEQLTSLHITRILTEITMFYESDPVIDAEYPVFVNDVFHHIDHFYHEKITLDLLSQLYSVSKFHLAREFKRCSGTTIKDYIDITRIKRAKVLLRNTSKSIEQIAQEVGFYNASHFIKHFHKREYVTPLFYRKQWTK